jgi:hypothetical protein
VNRRRVVIAVLVVAVLAIGGAAAYVLVLRPPERSVEAFCSELGEARELDASLASLDAERISADLAALRRAAEVAPPEIAPDVGVVIGLAEALAAAPDAMAETLRQREADLPAVTAAGTAIEAYAEANCGLDLGVSGSRPA